MQLPLFKPESAWRPPALSDLPSWAGAKRVAIDCETKDPLLRQMGPGVRRGAYITGISFAIEDGPAHYLPIRHAEGDNLPPQQVLDYVHDQCKHFEGEVVGAKLDYDLDFMAQEGIDFPSVKGFRDVQVAEPLIDEFATSYSLETISQKYLGIGKDEELLREAAAAYKIDPKLDMWKLPARFVGQYATIDVVRPLQVLRKQERVIDDEDLWDIYNLESKLQPVLVRMRRRGVRVDLDRLEQIEQWSLQQEAENLAELKRITGINVRVGSVWQAKALAPALEQQGVVVPTTAKTGAPSITQDFLKGLKNPAANVILRARKVNKLRTTFAASVREHMCNGRIHCTFNQVRVQRDDATDDVEGARFGRLSCVDPNMQQQPARDPELGPMWRKIYIPDEGGEWATLDYSQQEPFMTIHYAVKSNLKEVRIRQGDRWMLVDAGAAAREAAKRCWDNRKIDFHQMMADMCKIERKYAKEIFLGLCYGMGGAKLARKLGLPTQWFERHGKKFEGAGPEAQAIIDQFDREVPFVRVLAKNCELRAKKIGRIRTIGGRVCRFPKLADGSFDWAHKALNRLIQGSSGDQTKKAMIALDEMREPIQLQVHDEIDATVENKEHAERMADVMRNIIPLEVPSRVDVEIGRSWGEAA